MTTIEDVAAAAGVSISTVSHVINGTRFVSEDLRVRVGDAMQHLGYRPNALARSLRRGRSGTIGLILPDNANMFFAEIAREIEELGYQNGYSVFLCNTNDNLQKEVDYTATLLEKQVDGLLFISAGGSDESLRRIQAAGVPVVVVDREQSGVETDVILVDNHAGGFLAGQYLIRLGHRRIACISGPSKLTPSAQRVEGFLQALREAHIQFDPDTLISGDFRSPSGEDAMDRLLALGPRRPSAVFACNDMMAVGALRSAHRNRLEVPKNLSIIGFDDIPLVQAVSPALTTIAQPIEELAQKSIAMLLEQINARQAGKPAAVPKRVVLFPSLVERDSCAAWP